VPEKFYLQAGAFEDPSEADNLKARLALMGVEASVQKVECPRRARCTVRVGPYLGQDDEQGASSCRQRHQHRHRQDQAEGTKAGRPLNECFEEPRRNRNAAS
jgi:cell division protein FtsN